MSASNKSLLFLLGLVLGLLGGAGFFIFKMDDLLQKTNLIGSSKDTIVIQQQVPTEADKKKNKPDIKKYIGHKDTGNKMSSAELLAQKYSHEIPIKRIMAEADSLLRDTIGQDQSHQENFIVRKDELLGSRNIEVTNLQPSESGNSDSLLEKISGIKGKKNVFASFKVEFWQSPINYRGYKMSKNKILLFGIGPEENIRLFHYEDGVFMKKNQDYFRLYFTDEFKQFEKVTDAAIIGKLK